MNSEVWQLPPIAPGLNTPQRAAQALAAYARRHGLTKPRHPFPYNRFAYNDPFRDRVWWLGPERENPAYWRGKIICRSDHVGNAVIFIGFYAEKGLHPECLPLPEGKHQQYWIMRGDQWVWPTFLHNLAGGGLEACFATQQRASGMPVTVIVDASRPTDAVVSGEFVSFQWSEGKLVSVAALREAGPGGLLRHLEGAHDLASLGRLISKIPEYPCTWVDFHAGLLFRLADSVNNGWTEKQIWSAVVDPWSLWIR